MIQDAEVVRVEPIVIEALGALSKGSGSTVPAITVSEAA